MCRRRSRRWPSRKESPARKPHRWEPAILSIGTILGCVAVPIIAERIGRRKTLAVFFAIMFFSISVGFGYVFYLPSHALPWFQLNLFVLGIGGANFAIYTLWLPEQYRNGMPRQRIRLRDFVGTVPGRGHHVPGGRGGRAFRKRRDAGGADLDRIFDRPSLATLRSGDQGPNAAAMTMTILHGLAIAALLGAPVAAQETIRFSTEDGGTICANLYGKGSRGVVLATAGDSIRKAGKIWRRCWWGEASRFSPSIFAALAAQPDPASGGSPV